MTEETREEGTENGGATLIVASLPRQRVLDC